MLMTIREANDGDMYQILDIRNSGREYMTHHTEYITKREQEEWWDSPMRQQSLLFVVEVDNETVGFGMIRRMYDSGRNYGTLAFLPEYRGQGFGTALYRYMIAQVDELWIDVRNDNVASMNAALKAGFEVHYIGDHITELVAR